ncbi:MAG: hypothetical protein Q9219_004624 [cf. Caloplaca sp. 3 TL-2023]
MPFKFSFPLPGRKTSDQTNGSPILIDTPNDSHDDSPFSDPGSKAERVLGTMEPASSHSLSNKSSRKILRKKPSFMSVTRSEAGSDAGASRDGFPFPEMPYSRGSSRRPSHNLQNQASSPLLGERFFKGSPGTNSTTNSPSPRPHFYGSSSTLRSYYDPAKSPLSISQQTSASSARDMALRKGYPSISSPLSQDVSSDIAPSAIGNGQRSATDHDTNKGAAHIDLSTFSPKHQSPVMPVLSPDAKSKSPSQLSYSSGQQSASSGRPNWWKRKNAKESKSQKTKASPDDSHLRHYDLGLDSLKTNIKKPKAGTRYWFDGVGDCNSPGIQEQLDGDKGDGHFWNDRLHHLRSDTHELLASGLDQGDGDGSLFTGRPSANDSTTPQSAPVRHDFNGSLQEETSIYSDQRQTRSRGSTVATADLQNQSFLELSSSEDEDSKDYAVGHQIRSEPPVDNGRDHNVIGEKVVVPDAERVRPVKLKTVVAMPARRSKRGSEVIPPVPKIPERPQLQQRVSSMKWRELQNSKPPSVTTRTTDDSHSSSGGASIASRTSSLKQTGVDPHMRKPFQGSKIMAVTVEEGKLLEAIRQTRASTCHDAFSEAYIKPFNSPRSNIHRPRTSGTDGRTSYMGSDRSVSPPPSLPISNASPQSFRFPDVPSSSHDHNNNIDQPLSPTPRRAKPLRQVPPIIFPPPKSSPTDSFSPSDILPSTPRSRLSPLTPASTVQDENEDFGGGSTSGGGGPHGKRGARKGGHFRKRTVSSGVVMVGGMEEQEGAWGSEDEWVGVMGRQERW